MSTSSLLRVSLLAVVALGCAKKGNDKGDGGNSGGSPSQPASPYPNGSFDITKIKLSLSGATGIAKMDGASTSNLLFASDAPLNVGQAGGDNKLVKVTKEKKFEELLVNESGAGADFKQFTGGGPGMTPEIYKAPNGIAYVFFPVPLVSYEFPTGTGAVPTPPPDGKSGAPVSDSKASAASGGPIQKRCQIFRAEGNFAELTAENASGASLKCAFQLEEQQMIQPQFWGMQGAEPTLQFDNSGRIIFRMQTGPKGEIYRFDPNADKPLKLMVNSSFHVSKFFATPRGGLYYVGQPPTGGPSYFRYVNPNGGVQQIAEGSWGPLLFIPIKGDATDKVLYIGPHPNSIAANQPVNSVLKFNPDAGSEEDEDRLINQIFTMTSGGFQATNWYSNMLPAISWENWVTACTQTTVSGLQNLGYQAKIIQEDNGDFLFMNDSSGWSDFYYAPAGKVVCQTSSGFEVGANCTTEMSTVSGFNGYCVDSSVADNADQTALQAATVNVGNRYSSKTQIVRLKADGTLQPIPFPADFQIKKIWKIGNEFFYLHTKNNVFSLRRWVNGTSVEGSGDKKIKSNFEIYSLAKSGINELIFTGLDFSNNEYGVGYISTETFSSQMDEDVKVKISDVIPLD